MAITKACGIKVSVGNTGKECDTSMNATAMLIALHPSVKFTDDDLEDPMPWIEGLIHERRAFPLFGSKAPIRTITNNAESDVTITLDDGLIVFLRYGVYNRIFETTSGGFCYAKALSSFNKSGYNILEIDQTGQMLARKNSDGTYSGFITDFMYAPSPIWADFTNTPYKNRFQISFGPQEVVNNGVIFQGAGELLSLMGLIDVRIEEAAAATTTAIKVYAVTDCAEADLAELFPDELADPDRWLVTNKTTGAVVTITGVTITDSEIVLTGAFVSGETYIVQGNTSEDWYANDIVGYDGNTLPGVEITIP